jgi:hypothetical protein
MSSPAHSPKFRVLATLDAGCASEACGWMRDDYDQPYEFDSFAGAEAHAIDATINRPSSRITYAPEPVS